MPVLCPWTTRSGRSLYFLCPERRMVRSISTSCSPNIPTGSLCWSICWQAGDTPTPPLPWGMTPTAITALISGASWRRPWRSTTGRGRSSAATVWRSPRRLMRRSSTVCSSSASTASGLSTIGWGFCAACWACPCAGNGSISAPSLWRSFWKSPRPCPCPDGPTFSSPITLSLFWSAIPPA